MMSGIAACKLISGNFSLEGKENETKWEMGMSEILNLIYAQKKTKMSFCMIDFMLVFYFAYGSFHWLPARWLEGQLRFPNSR